LQLFELAVFCDIENLVDELAQLVLEEAGLGNTPAAPLVATEHIRRLVDNIVAVVVIQHMNRNMVPCIFLNKFIFK